jgi:hypothetical protein
MKKRLSILLALVLVFGMMVTACGGGAAPADAPTNTPEPAAEEPTATPEPAVEEPTATPEEAMEEPTPEEPVVEEGEGEAALVIGLMTPVHPSWKPKVQPLKPNMASKLKSNLLTLATSAKNSKSLAPPVKAPTSLLAPTTGLANW